MSTSTTLRRRTVTRTAAWAVPAVATAVAAPAYAASGAQCQQRGPGTILLQTVQDGDRTVPSTATAIVFPGGVSAWLSYDRLGSRRPHRNQPPVLVHLDPFDNTGQDPEAQTGKTGRAQYAGAWSYICLEHPAGMVAGDVLTMTITFTQPVQRFSLTLTQVDAIAGSYDDNVTLSPGGFAVTGKGSAISGDGTTTPFHSTSMGTTASPDHDVSVEWVGSGQQFVVSFAVGDYGTDSPCGQWMGVGNFVIDSCG